MTIEFRLPQFGMGMTDGTINVWYKAEGEAIVEGEPLLEVEAAKTNVEVTAPVSGVLARIVVATGENVPVQTVIAIIEDSATGQATAAGTEPAASAAPAGKASGGKVAATPLAKRVAAASNIDLSTVEARGQSGKVTRADVEYAASRTSPPFKVQIEPRARRVAQELGVDLELVTGSGKNGRIVEADIRAFAALAPPARPDAAGMEIAGDGVEGYLDVPHSRMRKFIARRLTESKQEVPHFYLVAHCEVDALMAARRQINETHSQSRVSLNDLIVRAVASALAIVPEANVAWTDEAMRHYSGVDVAVAVATDGGLITPIVRGAHAKPVRAIAAELGDLAARARSGGLAPDEYQGGTVSVSNLGMYGVEEFSAILNPPHACIFAVGAASERPVARDGQLAVASVLTCTLSVDHRAVDGAVAAKLLAAFKNLIERPAALLA